MGKGRGALIVGAHSVDQLFVHYFHNFWRVRVVDLVDLTYVLGRLLKIVSFFEEKSAPRLWICPPLEKILRERMRLAVIKE